MVLDAGAAVDLLLNLEPESAWVGERIGSVDLLHAPHLIDFEVAHAVRRLAMTSDVSAERGALALEHLGQLRLVRYPAVRLLDRVWELRHNLTAYDASYVALAEVLDVPLVTTDRSLARSRGHRAEVLTPAR